MRKRPVSCLLFTNLSYRGHQMNTKRLRLSSLIVAGALAFSSAAGAAELLINGNFESSTAGTLFPSGSYVAGSATTGWLDQATWATVNGTGTNHPNSGELAAPASPSGDNWARQFAGENTNIGTMLMQGFSAAGLAGGTQLQLSFDYITDNAEQARFVVFGMDAGETFSQFPPNGCSSCDLLAGSLVSNNLALDLGQWTTFSTTIVLPREFTAIGFGIYFGSNTLFYPNYVGGIDNASIQAASIQAVPEPGTVALLGIALAGLCVASRRKAG